MRVANQVAADGKLTTRLWSHKAARSLLIDWQAAEVETQPRSTTTEGLELAETLAAEQPSRGSLRIRFGLANLADESSECIGITVDRGLNDTRRHFIPYKHRLFLGTQCFGAADYPVAAMPKMLLLPPRGLGTIMVFDIVRGSLICEIEPPPEARTSRPDFALDRRNNVLIAAGFDVNWLMVLDLGDYLAGLSSPPVPDPEQRVK
jgi:hypothetical protein